MWPRRDEITSHVGRRASLPETVAGICWAETSGAQDPVRLSLFRFDPETLAIQRHVILDNDEGNKVSTATTPCRIGASKTVKRYSML